MAHRELELTLLSARDLKSVNLFTRMDVYAVASISGDPMTRQCTPTDTSGGRNPSWNATFRFNVPPSAAAASSDGGGWIHVLLRSERAFGDRDVGEVVLPLAELLSGVDGPGPQLPRLASYQVHTVLRGEPRGVLNVSYRLGPVVAPVERAGDKSWITGYPVAPAQPFKPQNPQQWNQYSPPDNAYWAPQQPFKPQNPAPPQQSYQYSPPQNAYAPSYKPQNSPSPYQYSPPHYTYRPQPRHEARPPANGKNNEHEPTQVYMGPHTQIIFNSGGPPTPWSNTMPQAKEDGPIKSKPYYAPTQPNTILAKEDESTKPKLYYTPTQPNNTIPAKEDESKPKPYYTPTQPNNTIPTKEDEPTKPKPYYAPTQSNNTIPVKEDGPTKPKPYYAPTQPNNTIPTKEDGPTKPKPYYAPTQPNNTIPAKEDGLTKPKPYHAPTQPNDIIPVEEDGPTKPKPYYAPPQPKASPGKTDYNHQNWPNASPQKPDHSSRTQHEIKVSGQAHTQSKIGPVKTDHSTRNQQQVSDMSSRKAQVESTQSNSKAADSIEAYATNRSNSTPPGKADHQSGAKSALQQYERVHSLQTAAAR